MRKIFGKNSNSSGIPKTTITTATNLVEPSQSEQQRRPSSSTAEMDETTPTVQWWNATPKSYRLPPKAIDQQRLLMTRAVSDLASLMSAGLQLQFPNQPNKQNNSGDTSCVPADRRTPSYKSSNIKMPGKNFVLKIHF
jgi:hypothetical protein